MTDSHDKASSKKTKQAEAKSGLQKIKQI